MVELKKENKDEEIRIRNIFFRPKSLSAEDFYKKIAGLTLNEELGELSHMDTGAWGMRSREFTEYLIEHKSKLNYYHETGYYNGGGTCVRVAPDNVCLTGVSCAIKITKKHLEGLADDELEEVERVVKWQKK